MPTSLTGDLAHATPSHNLPADVQPFYFEDTQAWVKSALFLNTLVRLRAPEECEPL